MIRCASCRRGWRGGACDAASTAASEAPVHSTPRMVRCRSQARLVRRRVRRRVRSTGFLSRGRSTGPFRTWQAERRGDDAQGEGMERVLRAGRHEQAGGGALLPPPALQIQSPAARKECPPCCLPALLPPPPPPPHTTPTRAVLGPKSISFSRGAYDQARVEKRCKQRGRGEGICVPAGKARCTCSTCPHGIPLTTSSSHAALAVPPASGLVPPPPSLTFLSAFQCLISKNRTLPAGGTVGSGDTTKAWARARLQALGRALPQLLPCRPPTSGRQPKPPAHRYPPGGMLRSWLVRRVTAEGGSPAQPSPARPTQPTLPSVADAPPGTSTHPAGCCAAGW